MFIQSFVNKYKATGFYANEEEIRQNAREQFERMMTKKIEPIRLMYPFFEKPTKPYSKCPIWIGSK